MPHNPYGYCIVDGKAEIDEEQAMKVRDLFENYISGMGLRRQRKKPDFQFITAVQAGCSATPIIWGMSITLPSSTRRHLIEQKKDGRKRQNI